MSNLPSCRMPPMPAGAKSDVAGIVLDLEPRCRPDGASPEPAGLLPARRVRVVRDGHEGRRRLSVSHDAVGTGRASPLRAGATRASAGSCG